MFKIIQKTVTTLGAVSKLRESEQLLALPTRRLFTSRQNKAPTVEKLPLPSMTLGEGPHWSVETQSLYLIDILNSKVYRYHPASGKYFSVKLDVPSIGHIVPVSGTKDKFFIGAGTSLYTFKWDGSSSKVDSLEPLQSLAGEPDGTRINDGKCDPVGRVWFGTMKTTDVLNGRIGSFYSYSKEKGVTKHLTEVGISNGLAWDLKKNRMYYIDTPRHSVDALDYNTDGTIGNRRVVFDLEENNLPFHPDGMTIDADGNLWVACFMGSRVINIDPDSKKLLGQVDLPTARITSAAWGGADLSELYVTSATAADGEEVENDDPNAGATFRVTGLSARGLPMTDFKL